MRNPDEFDEFYKAARQRLLLQTYALTGDLPAARSAVRDAFVAAWHHWRKVARLPDPEGWIRPHAWAHAQRRHSARIWHRDKSLDPSLKSTLDALSRLSVDQRKALLLTQTSSITMAEMARELGLTDGAADQQLQTAARQFALHREVPSSAIRLHLQALEQRTADVRFPRPTIIRRAGAARRRAHTTAGALAVVAAVALSGTLVAQDGGVAAALRDVPDRKSDDAGRLTELDPLEPGDLLTREQLGILSKSRPFGQPETTDNTDGDGINTACQQERFADPDGMSALVRTFRASGKPALTAVQAIEQSANVANAAAAYDTTVRWYAECRDERVQLLAAHRVGGLGDEAMLLVLRGWKRPVTTYTVGIARTGGLVTSVVRSVADGTLPKLLPVVGLMTRSVQNLCHHEGAGACTGKALMRSMPPPAAQSALGMLQVVDLPPASGVTMPWVGTEPSKPRLNPAATPCDSADFAGRRLTFAATRSFLVPQAKLPARFGISETIGRFRSAKLADGFAAAVAQRMAGCEDRDRGLGTTVTQLQRRSGKRTSLTVWHQVTEISDKNSVSYYMAIVRRDRVVAQLNFVPVPGATIDRQAFSALAERALARLANLPAT